MKKYYKLVRPYKDSDFFKVNVIYREDMVVPPNIWALSILVREHTDNWIEVFPKFKFGR